MISLSICYDVAMKTNRMIIKIMTILVFLLLLVSLRLLWIDLFSVAKTPKAIGGTLDLRGYSLKESLAMNLDGEWLFYPSNLVSAKDLPFLSTAPELVNVPGDWQAAFGDQADSSYGYGTYRLRIQLDPIQEPISLWIKEIQSASIVELNGKTFPAQGKVAAEAELYRPSNAAYKTAYFEEGTSSIDLLIRVANYDNPFQGGIEAPILLGYQSQIDALAFLSSGALILTIVILLLHCLYGVILYTLNRQEHALLLVSLMTLSVAIILMARPDNILFTWLPINYTWSVKIRLLAFIWQNLLILLVFQKFLFKSKLNKWLRIYTLSLVGYSVFILCSTAPVISTALRTWPVQVYQFIPFICLLVTIGQLWREYKRNNDLIFPLLSALAILNNYAWSLAGYSGSSTLMYYPIDILTAIVGFSVYWFKQYFRHARENIKYNEQLRMADKRKDLFLANTSHELRTPLHGIMNIARNIERKEREHLTESSREELNLLVTVSQRMSHILDDLLDVVRLKEHRITLKQEAIYIQAVVPGVVSMLKYLTEGKPVKLIADIPEDLPQVMADEKRLVQILYNLLHNALKYTDEGHVMVSAKYDNNYVQLQISDTGSGMDEATIHRVFDPYEQGNNDARDGQGIGLGLSICKQLVELHGSELLLQSELGKGSVFSFQLFLANAAIISELPKSAPYDEESDFSRGESGIASPAFLSSSHEKARATDPAMLIPPLISNTRLSLLLVDDDPVNLNVLKGMLAEEPYEIKTARSVQEALDLLDAKRYDLLISDVMMPGLSGYELTKLARARFSISELPILLLTARSQPADIYTGFLAGANDYVTKPVDALELRYRIRALAATKHSYNERLRLEAAYLQSQISPHFLFNTLNSIAALSELDNSKMRQLIDAFSTFLRISFSFKNTRELIQLSHELSLVKAYLYIEETRYAERLSIMWDMDAGLDVLVPPLSIQPLVENAIKHGIQYRAGMLNIEIHIVKRERSVLVQVKDNGPGIEPATLTWLLDLSLQNRSGIGLNNTHRRLIQLFGQGLTIHSQPGEGTTVSFTVPVR